MTREFLNTERKELLTTMRKITRKSSCCIVSKHNTVLALRNSATKKITHLISPKERNGLVVVFGSTKELYVPRYEPKTANTWLREIDEDFNRQQESVFSDCGFKFEKCLLSEKELKSTVLDYMKFRLKYLNSLNKMSDETLLRW